MKASNEQQQTTIYFVSGHLDLTQEEFAVYYEPQLRKAIFEGATGFVVGDARGCDFLAQRWLRQVRAQLVQGAQMAGDHAFVPFSVHVYHMLERPRVGGSRMPKVGGFLSDEERDAAMTAASTHDIAWVRPGRERSGTAKNLKRRVRVNRDLKLQQRASWPVVQVEQVWDDFGTDWVLRAPGSLGARPVRVPPGFEARYVAAQREVHRVRSELGKLVVESTLFHDEDVVAAPVESLPALHGV